MSSQTRRPARASRIRAMSANHALSRAQARTMINTAIKAGAVDFIAKPVSREELVASLERATAISRDASKHDEWRASARSHLAGLTIRQVEVMNRVLAGEPSKNIAADLNISQRTVENHRAAIMRRTGSKSLPALARLALLASDGAEKRADAALNAIRVEARIV